MSHGAEPVSVLGSKLCDLGPILLSTLGSMLFCVLGTTPLSVLGPILFSV